MDIHLNSCFNYTVHILREDLLRSLTEKQKKIAIIVGAALACLAACYFIKKCCFNATRLSNQNEDLNVRGRRSPFLEEEEEVQSPQLGKVESDSPKKETVLDDSKQDKVQSDFVDPDLSSPKTPQVNKEEIELDAEESLKNQESLPYEPPVLQNFGAVRQGKGGGEAPSFMGGCSIDSEKLWTAGFACCFHTTESHEEIYQLLMDIRIKHDPMARNSKVEKHYPETLTNLYNHLVKLHDALPGDSKAKKVKIYWNERIETLLFPYFYQENISIDNLLFAIIPGEECQSPFQASEMNFFCQLEFVGLNKYKLIHDMSKEINRMGNILTGGDILPEINKEIINRTLNLGTLMGDAHVYTLMNHCRLHLRSQEEEGKTMDWKSMSEDERSKFVEELMKP